MANEVTFDGQDAITEIEGIGVVEDVVYIGLDTNVRNAAVRFSNVNIPKQTISYASLLIYQGINSSGKLKFITNGLDEDNTAEFGSSWPGGRPRTTAQDVADNDVPSQGSYKQITVTSIVNEIVNRGGWSSGNAIGFIMQDNGSDAGTTILGYDSDAYLSIRVNAEPNFKPTPKSIAAPTFPATSDYGIRISKPGVDVRTATESQLFFTTRKKEFKVINEAEITTSAVPHLVSHGLSYSPSSLVYAQFNNKVFKLNRMFDPNYEDPITGYGGEGYFGSDDTDLEIYTGVGTKVYYYIFIDELE